MFLASLSDLVVLLSFATLGVDPLTKTHQSLCNSSNVTLVDNIDWPSMLREAVQREIQSKNVDWVDAEAKITRESNESVVTKVKERNLQDYIVVHPKYLLGFEEAALLKVTGDFTEEMNGLLNGYSFYFKGDRSIAELFGRPVDYPIVHFLHQLSCRYICDTLSLKALAGDE